MFHATSRKNVFEVPRSMECEWGVTLVTKFGIFLGVLICPNFVWMVIEFIAWTSVSKKLLMKNMSIRAYGLLWIDEKNAIFV